MPSRLLLSRMPWYYGWNVLLVVVLIQAFVLGLSGAYSAFIGPLVDEYTSTRAIIAFGYTGYFLGLVLFSPFVYRVINRVGERKTIVVGLSVLATGHLLSSLAIEIYQLLIVYGILVPLGTALAGIIPSTALVENWFAEHDRRGLALGISAAGLSIGSFLLPPLTVVIIDLVGWRHTFHLFAIFGVSVLTAIVWLVVNDAPVHTRRKGIDSEVENQLPLTAIVKEPIFIALVISTGLGGLVYSGVLINFISIAVNKGYQEIQGAVLISFLTAGMFFGKLLVGATSEKVHGFALLILCLVTSAASVWLVGYLDLYPMLILVSFCLGLGSGGYLPLIGILIGDYFLRHSFAKVLGFVMPGVFLFTAAGPPLAAQLYDTSGSYSGVFTVFALMLGICAIALALLFRRQVHYIGENNV